MKKLSRLSVIVLVLLLSVSCIMPDFFGMKVTVKDSVLGDSVVSVPMGSSYEVPKLGAEGYVFRGMKDEAGRLWAPGESMVITGNTVLTSVWEKNINECKVTFVYNDGTQNEKLVIDKGGSFLIPVRTREGYTCSIKCSDNTTREAGKEYTAEHDIVITWTWKEIPAEKEKVTVTYVYGDGTPEETFTLDKGGAFTVPVRTREGYTPTITCSDSAPREAGKEYTADHDIVITWNWSPEESAKCMVTLVVGPDDIREEMKDRDSIFTIPSIPERRGFSCTITDGNGGKWSAGETIQVTGDITFTWNWTEKKKVSVKFVFNEGTADETLDLYEGESFSVPKKTKEYHVVSSISGDDGSSYSPERTYTASSDLVLTWKWVRDSSWIKVTCMVDEGDVREYMSQKGSSWKVPLIEKKDHTAVITCPGIEFPITAGDDITLYDDETFTWTWTHDTVEVVCWFENGKTEIINVPVNTEWTVPTVDERQGWIYSICNIDDPSMTLHAGDVITVSSSLHLMWDWKEVSETETVKITYKLKDGTTLTDTVEKGTQVTLPRYGEDVWGSNKIYVDEETKEEYMQGGIYVFTKDTVLMVEYVVNEYTVTCRITEDDVRTFTFKHGETFTVPEVPGREGFRTLVSSGSMHDISAGSEFSVYKDMVFEWRWEPLRTVRFIIGENDVRTEEHIDGETFTVPDMSRIGWRYVIGDEAGHTYEANESYTVNGDVTLRWEWTKLMHIIYDFGDAFEREERWLEPGEQFSIPERTVDGKKPVITDRAGNKVAAGTVYRADTDMSFCWIWKDIHTIRFILPDGTEQTLGRADGESFTVPDVKAEPDHIISVIGDDGRTYLPGNSYSTLTDLVLTWKSEYVGDKYELMLSWDGNMETVWVKRGSEWKIPVKMEDPKYIFKVKVNGSYLDQGDVITVDGDKTLTWESYLARDGYHEVRVIFEPGNEMLLFKQHGDRYDFPGHERPGWRQKKILTNGKFDGSAFLIVKERTVLEYTWTKLHMIELVGSDEPEAWVEVEDASTWTLPWTPLREDSLVNITDQDGTVHHAGDTFTVGSDMKFTWDWRTPEKDDITVTVNATGLPQKTYRAERNVEFPLPDTEREGWKLIGIKDASGRSYQADEKCSSSGDIELNYEWEKIPEYVVVTIMADGEVFSRTPVVKGSTWSLPDIYPYRKTYNIRSDEGVKHYVNDKIVMERDMTFTYHFHDSIRVTLTSGNRKGYRWVEPGCDFEIPSVPGPRGDYYLSFVSYEGRFMQPGDVIPRVTEPITLNYVFDRCFHIYLDIPGERRMTVLLKMDEEYRLPAKEVPGKLLLYITRDRRSDEWVAPKYQPGDMVTYDHTGTSDIFYYVYGDIMIVKVRSEGEKEQKFPVPKSGTLTLPSIERPGYVMDGIFVNGRHLRFLIGDEYQVNEDTVIEYSWRKL